MQHARASSLASMVLCASLALLAVAAHGDELAKYTFGSNTQSIDTDPNSTASVFAHDFKAGVGTETADVGRSSGQGVYFVRANKTDGSDESTAVAQDDYCMFTVTPSSGFELDLVSLSFAFSLSRDNSSPDISYPAESTVFVRSSVDGYAATLIASVATRSLANSSATYPTTAVTVSPALSSAAFQNLLGPVTFRIYIYDNQTTSQLFSRIDNVILNGVSSVAQCGTVVLIR